jgi:DNA-binding MarR family transcriptional regulator
VTSKRHNADSEPAGPATETGVGERVFAGIVSVVRWASRADVRRRLLGATEAVLPVVEVELLRTLTSHGPMRVSELAQRHGVDKSTVAPPINRLERRGLVARHGDPGDRRAVLVAATGAGCVTREEMDRTGARVVEELLAHWGEPERTALAELLTRLSDELATAPRGRDTG